MIGKGFSLGLALAAGLLASAGAKAADLLYNIKMGETHTADAVMTRTAQKFADLVAEKTGGRMKITVFPNSQIGDEAQLLQKVLAPGSRDISSLSVTILTTVDPSVGVTNLPFLFRDGKHLAAFETSDAFEAQRQGLIKNRGLRMLGAWDYGFINIYTKRPVTELADLKGMKVRVPPAADYVRMFQLLGTNPTPVPFGELYMALQTGVVDGTISAIESVITSKFSEVAKFDVDARYQVVFGNPTMSEKFYESLPKDIQTAIDAAGKEATLWNRAQIEASDKASRAKLEEAGVKILEVKDLDKWKAALKPYYDDFTTKYGGDLVKKIQALD